MPSRDESRCQQNVIRWWHYMHRTLGAPDERLLFAVPNGGKRGKIEGARLKGEGVRAGIPDLMLAVPRKPYSGLFIEMKTWVGKPSPEQVAMMALLHEQKYETVVCHGHDQAVRAITAYMQGKPIERSFT